MTDVDEQAERLKALIDADPEAARALLLAQWRELAVAAPELVRHAAVELSDASPREDPMLTLAYGASFRYDGGGARAGQLLERLRERIRRERPPADLAIDIDLELASAYRCAGRLVDASVVLDEVDLTLGQSLPLAQRFRRAARARHERALIALHEGRFTLAERLPQQSLPTDELSSAERAESKGAAAFVAWTNGAFDALDTLLSSSPDLPAVNASTALSHATRCLVAVERGDLAGALVAADAADAAGLGTEWEGFVRYARATTAVLSGDTAGALNELDQAERAVLGWQGTPVIATLCAGMRAVMLLHMGQVEAATTILRELPPSENHSNCPARFRAALALLRGDIEEARNALESCLELGAAHSKRTLVDVFMLLAAIAYLNGEDRSGDLAFDRAVRMASANQMQVTFYLLQFSVLDAMLVRAATRPQPAGVDEHLTQVRRTAAARPFALIEPLTEREREVAILAAEGSTTSAIAGRLWISPNTAKAHLRSIYRKLAVSSRPQLRQRLRALGVHQGEPPQKITRRSPDAG